jgi:hypothetical protein
LTKAKDYGIIKVQKKWRILAMKKILVNACYGGFGLKDEYWKEFFDRTKGIDDIREDEKLIALVEQGVDIGDNYAEIGIAEIPDNATDYVIEEYDGKETVLYVVDGKIRYAENKMFF